MTPDKENLYRPLLEDDQPSFWDRVNSPWESVSDDPQYNSRAYDRILRALKQLSKSAPGQSDANSQGILVLGEAGTGKTHLLMRVARNLAKSNQILFVRKPNNEDAVAQHIWAEIVQSLTRTLPTGDGEHSQLDDMLAHVFSRVLIPEFERDIAEGKGVAQRKRWVDRLKKDAFSLFSFLGAGKQRQSNMEQLRRRTLRFLKVNHPEVDQTFAHVLITYCFVSSKERKRVLLNWLGGQDIDETEAELLGLPTSWVAINDDSRDVSALQQRESQALRAIRTIGVLSTYYQPLILAFDQLEGLRDQQRLTRNWGDVVREIFTLSPNFLVITCIFPSLWESWFSAELDASVRDRIAQQDVTLAKFRYEDGLALLTERMKGVAERHRLPTSIYPFTKTDVRRIARGARSPRAFIHNARAAFQDWLDGDASSRRGAPKNDGVQQDVESVIRETFQAFAKAQQRHYGTELVLEHDLLGRLRSVTDAVLLLSRKKASQSKAEWAHYVMPPNLILRYIGKKEPVCIAVMNSEGRSFFARMRNLNQCFEEGKQFGRLIIIRDARSREPGPRGQELLEAAEQRGAITIVAQRDEVTLFNAVYDSVVAAEEHDLNVGEHEVDKKQLVAFLRSEGILSQLRVFKEAARYCPPLKDALGPQKSAAPAPTGATPGAFLGIPQVPGASTTVS